MAIIEIETGGLAMTLQSMSDRACFATSEKQLERETGIPLDPDLRNEGECCDIIKVFALPSNLELVYNDSFDLLETFFLNGGTVDYELWKDNEKIDDLNNDDYGKYYPAGSFLEADGFSPAQEKLVGYQGRWLEVYNIHGPGFYRFKTIIFDGIQTVEKQSCCYHLQLYSDEVANGTVSINAFQNGYVINSRIDYTGLRWTKHYRVEGYFGRPKRNNEETWFVNKLRREEQIQQEIRKDFEFDVKWPRCLGDSELDEMLLSNELYFTDYNIKNPTSSQFRPVKWNGEEEVEYFSNSLFVGYMFTFEELDRTTLKRNVR